MTGVDLRVTRALLLRGQRQEVGTVLTLAPTEALDLAETGRVEFVDPADAQRCMQARREAIARSLRRIHVPTDAGPWRPAGYA